MIDSLEALERQRAEILKQIAALGDMRPGSIAEQYLKCGKSTCCCKEPGHTGHGPYFAFTRKVNGKTQTRQLRPGPALARLKREIEAFHRFRELSNRLIEINEGICELRPVEGAGSEEKKTLLPAAGRTSGKKLTGWWGEL